MISELGKWSSFATPACGRRRGWRSRLRCAHGSPRASADDPGRARSVGSPPVRLTGWRTSATVRLPQRPATRHRRPCAASPSSLGAQGQCPRRGGEGASLWTRWLERGARFSGPLTVGKRALAPQSINLIVKRPCALVGLDATEFASAWSEIGRTSLRAGASRCPGRCNSGSSVRCSRVPGYKSEADPGRVTASRLTL